jgi:hypothetical protein
MNWAGILIQALMFIFVLRASKKGVHFNPLTYILYAGLSVVTLVVTIFEKGSWMLVLAWIFCDSIIFIHLVRKGEKVEFGKFEKTVVLLTICTAAVYAISKYMGHGIIAVYACTIALSVACIPAMVDYKRKPIDVDVLVWTLYTVSNFFCFFGQQPMNVENSLIPGVIGALCAIVLYWGVRARYSSLR